MRSRPTFDIDTRSLRMIDNGARWRGIDDTRGIYGKYSQRRSRVKSLSLYTSDWVHEFVNITDANTGKISQIDFSERPYLRKPYNTNHPKILLVFSRQTEKSTSTGNKLIALSNTRSFYNSLFVTPSALQTTTFSKTRIDDIVSISPHLKASTHKALNWNLLEKTWLNGSKIYLRYAFLNADRIRGLSVNAIFIDEIQDVLRDVVPVIEETSSHNKNRIFVYSGTPKTFDNTIHTYWEDHSTQSEWVGPCEHHGTPKDPKSWHWNILDSGNIGTHGPICERCGKAINPEHPEAQWVEMNPGAEYHGYRVCRLMVPWYVKDPKAWASILDNQKRYPRAQFENEVMARSYDSGTKPITKGELYRLCDPKYMMDEEQVAALAGNQPLYGGIDWGTGEKAYTLFTVGGYVRGDHGFQIVYAKRFDGPLIEPKPQLHEIRRLIDKFRLKFVGTDYGMGHWPNKLLISLYGPKRIFPFMHAERLDSKVKYSPKLGRHVVYRSPVIGDIFSAMKMGKIRLPAREVFDKPFITDISNVTAEYSHTLKMMKFDKARGVTDDTLHSILYTILASCFAHARPDIFAPIQEGGTAMSLAELNELEYLENVMPPEEYYSSEDPFYEDNY